jgi:NAD(P)-dependent dehydrogenase (short-subunit alcohol dehydrogenase family)
MRKSIDTNVTGTLYAINAFLPLVKKSKIKKVIVLTTGHADEKAVKIVPITALVPYALSKVAVNMLVLKYACQFKDEGIVFLALSPGNVLTEAESLETGMFDFLMCPVPFSAG